VSNNAALQSAAYSTIAKLIRSLQLHTPISPMSRAQASGWVHTSLVLATLKLWHQYPPSGFHTSAPILGRGIFGFIDTSIVQC
jgi:hypothetical protein